MRFRFSQGRSNAALSIADDFPADASGWIAEMNSHDAPAPEGGPAFITGAANDATGAVGILYSGSAATNDASVTVSRPAYQDLSAISVTLNFADF